MTAMIRFVEGVDRTFTNVEIDLPDEVFETILNKISPDFALDFGYAAAEYFFGPNSVCACLYLVPGEKKCFLEVPNLPEGDERLDGMSPDFWSARDTLWIDLVPSVKALFAGNLPPYRISRTF
jgi:hypothetical protein